MAYEYTRQSYLADDECYLLTPKTYIDDDGIVRDNGFEEVRVMCEVSSVYQTEFLKAYEAGIKPRWRLIIQDCDYEDETLIRYNGELFNVYRTFRAGDKVELYLRKDEGHWQNERIK